MRVIVAAVLATSLSTAAGAEEWIKIPSPDSALSIEYRKESIETVSPSVRRAQVRFVATNGKNVGNLDLHSVASEIEYYCKQPLEKLMRAEIVAADGTVSSRQEIDPPVYDEIPHGSNRYRLWQEICSIKSSR
jgi:hypothetical protein